jgi:hypothetical protein
MKTFVKPIAFLGVASALMVGAIAPQANARDASAFTSANNASYYINGAYAYENAPVSRAVPAVRGAHESYAYAPRAFNAPQSFGAPVRPDDVATWEQRHLNGTE